MKCSYMTRCNDPKITYFDDIYICDNRSSIFKKHNKN